MYPRKRYARVYVYTHICVLIYAICMYAVCVCIYNSESAKVWCGHMCVCVCACACGCVYIHILAYIYIHISGHGRTCSLPSRRLLAWALPACKWQDIYYSSQEYGPASRLLQVRVGSEPLLPKCPPVKGPMKNWDAPYERFAEALRQLYLKTA